MGCIPSTPTDPEAFARNKEIESQLRKDKNSSKKQVNILLLGAGESGKSTVLKQMKLMYDGEYNEQERQAYKEIIFSNTVQCMVVVLQAMETLGLCLQEMSPNTGKPMEEYANIVMGGGQSDRKQSMEIGKFKQQWLEGEYMPNVLSEALAELWNDMAVKTAVRRSKEFQLNDSASYFFGSVERYGQPGYMPTNQDILRSRVKTTGITETLFNVNGMDYKVLDVGGQRSERRKWIHCFENVTALIFIISLSEYDQVLYEDDSVNRMTEALTLFDAVVNSRWFVKSSIILFLNKIDLLEEKLPYSPLQPYFEDYDGPEGDFNSACDYFRRRFLSLTSSNKKVITHFTCATDTRSFIVVMRAINEHILKANLEEVGFV